MINIRSSWGSSNLLLIVFAVFALIAGMMFSASQQERNTSSNVIKLPDLQSVTLLPKPKKLTDHSFTDHTGKAFTKQQFIGKWSLVFFGFTNCPDICPATMHTLKQIKLKVQDVDAWQNYQVILVSIDPKRDTVERLSKYVPFFDQSFIGITGAEQDTLEFTKNLGIIYAYHETNDEGNYNVDHSASIVLISPQAELAGIISAPHSIENISNDLIKFAQSDYSKNQISAAISSSTSTEQSIEISNAWVRTAPPGATALAAYVTIQNNTESPVTISGVSSPQFSMSMLHETVIENDIASMQHTESIEVESGKRFEMKPQGTHIMLMSPKEAVAAGDQIDITLTTDSGNDINVSAEVRSE